MIYKKSGENYKKKKITLGLVAARKGSIGVKGKNLIKIRNQEITKIALNLAIKCTAIDNVILSTDSHKILNLIKKNKKLLKLKRNKSLAKNNTPMLSVMKNAIIFFEKIKKKKISNLVIFDPTSPLRSQEDIKNAIENYLVSEYQEKMRFEKAEERFKNSKEEDYMSLEEVREKL